MEGIGDHGCEYMTGGKVVILGDVGQNFGAGMSGGIAYVLPSNIEHFKAQCNTEMIEFEKLESKEEIELVRQLIIKHLEETDSTIALDVLAKWNEMIPKFVKVVPSDYKQMLQEIEHFKNEGLQIAEATLKAFTTITTTPKLVVAK